MYDLIIVGAGPAGIFTALELLRKSSTPHKILLVEKGKPVEKRHCPKAELGHCVNCRPTCAITTGFSGAGAFSDGKLSLSYEVGGDLPTLIGEEFAQELIHYTDKIYLEFGADPHVEGIYTGEDIKEIRKNAIHAGLKLVDCPIRHLGTEKAQQLYLAIQNYLADNGVEMLFSTECENIILENEECKGVFIKGPKDEEAHAVYADTVVIGTGRRGADWLEKICAEHHIAHNPGTVDIGVRVECRNEVMEKVNKVLYESKLIGYPKPWKNKVRTFCQNPGGFVAQENYDNDLAVVNGHSFKEKKSENTNLAILVSHNFTEPFNQPIAYAQKVGELTNMLGAGHIMVQRYGDILDGKRTWQKELAQSNVKPTLKDAVAGDITAAMPYRAMTNIIEFIKMMDEVVPGFASPETLLYSPELKFYSNRVKMDENLNTNVIADVYIPKIGFTVSATIELNWYTASQTLYKDGTPIAYMDLSGELKPYTEECKQDPYLQWLVFSYNEDQFRRKVVPFAGYLNLRVQKSVTKYADLAFFVNKLLDYLPDYKVDGVTIHRSTSPYFGMEINLKI